MIITALNGSPHTEGNTKYLLKLLINKVQSLGAEIQMIDVAETLKTLKKPFCTVCSNPCSGACYSGTELDLIFKILKDSDAIVLGSPVYFGTVSAQMKAFFDMTRKLRQEKVLYNKFGAAVAVGASRFGGQETTIRALQDIMLIHGMVIVGDGYKDNDCGHQGVCGQGPVENHEFAIKRVEILANRLVELWSTISEK
jgi:multimeric flavodoxin WrbA